MSFRHGSAEWVRRMGLAGRPELVDPALLAHRLSEVAIGSALSSLAHSPARAIGDATPEASFDGSLPVERCHGRSQAIGLSWGERQATGLGGRWATRLSWAAFRRRA